MIETFLIGCLLAALGLYLVAVFLVNFDPEQLRHELWM